MSNNPFGHHMPGAQPGQPQPGYAQPGYPPQGAPPQQQQAPQGWGAPQGAPPQQQQAPQGWGAPQGAPSGYSGPPPAGYGQPSAPAGFTQNMPTALPPGISESGDSTPLIMKPGNFVLQYEKHMLSTQSATLFFYFKILQSDVAEYPAGMVVKWIKKFSEAPGHWKWNKDAGWVLALIRPLMGFNDPAAFQAVSGWDQFVVSIIRGEPRPELAGRMVRDIVSYQLKDGQVKTDRQRGQPFMAHDWRVAT